MRLEDLTIVLRPRKPWEAVDLGCALVRRDFGRLLGLWAITVVPLWIILAALLWRHPVIFGLIVWWLKPLYDRVPLHFISSAAFGVRPSFRQTLKAWPRLWSRFLLSALFIRRLSPIRSFTLPVWMLEGQRGSAVRQRAKSLATDGFTPAVYATIAFLHLEAVITIGLFVLTSSLAPESGFPDFSEFLIDPNFDPNLALGFEWYLNILYLVAITVAEPFYVGAGFGLYINSRTKLEGWDIELTFRKLAARLRPAAVVLVLFASLLTMQTGRAIPLPERSAITPNRATGPNASPSPDLDGEAAETAKKILAKPEFKIHKHKKMIRVPTAEELEKERAEKAAREASGGKLNLFEFSVSAFGWACLAALIGLLLWWLYRNRHLFRFSLSHRQQPKPQGPRIVMGLDLARESLPTDLLTSARAAWQQGHPREALSLLYRGALSRLIEQRRLPIRDSDTEDDCLAHVAKSGEAGMTDYFCQLTRLWVRAAYAGIEAGADEFENLCRAWPFDKEGQKARTSPRILLLGLGLLPVLSSCSGEMKEVEVITGYKGPARSNPFLAAEQLLEEYGYEAERLTVLKKLPETGSEVLILSGEAGMTEARSRQLLNWVSDSGGHLVYTMAGCKPYDDWAAFAGDHGYAYFGNDKRVDPLLKTLNVTATDRRMSADAAEAKRKEQKKKLEESQKDNIDDPDDIPTRKNQVAWGGQTYELELPDYVTFKLNRKLHGTEFSAGQPDKATVLGLKYGSGRVTLLNHARPLRNRYLADHDHAAWLLALMGDDTENVQFVLTIETSIWRMLWQKGWMPLLALAVLVVFWLWRTLPRFGPVSHVELHDTKHFSQHVSALGHFFHGLRRDDILLNAAADAVRTRALRRFPQLRGLGEEALLPILAERSGLSVERIQTLLTPAVPSQPYHLVRLLQDLQTLRQAVG